MQKEGIFLNLLLNFMLASCIVCASELSVLLHYILMLFIKNIYIPLTCKISVPCTAGSTKEIKYN